VTPEVKELWVTALRSGTYQQGQGALRRDDTYCCLGVLCDLYAQVHPTAKWSDRVSPQGFMAGQGSDFYASPPAVVHEWSGLPSEAVSWLIHMNDGSAPFHQIADRIEATL
jgi:hypothetical protein